MNILLTGATGFIGSKLCRVLAADKHNRIFSLERTEHPQTNGVITIPQDLSEPIDQSRLPDKIDAVVHLALARDFRRFPEGTPGLFNVNVRTTYELLEYARMAGASRFFMASTGNCYAPDPGLATGDVPVPPNDFYTASKLAAEALTRPYQSCFNVNILRAFFPYGPNQDAKMIQRMIARIKANEPIALAQGPDGDGDVLSLIHVDDLIQIIARSLLEGWRGLFDVAAPEVLSVRQIAMEIGRQLEIKPVFADADIAAKKLTADLGPLIEKGGVHLRTFAEGLSDLISRQRVSGQGSKVP